MTSARALPASFRDPSGFVFDSEGVLYRHVAHEYRDNYDHLISSGLHDALTSDRLLVPHEEVEDPRRPPHGAYKVLRPERVEFLSYPYEWCLGQLADAAALTLRVQRTALEYGMTLKDASAYNVQFSRGKPVFIDTLSFELYNEGQPWTAYRQFCQQFVAPLALMSRIDPGLGQLLKVHLDGIPLDLASRLLGRSTWLSLSIATHIHLHARFTRRSREKTGENVLSRTRFLALISSLESMVGGITSPRRRSSWGDYYHETNYTAEAFEHKRALVGEFLRQVDPVPSMLWDLGANNGLFSRVASAGGTFTVAFDLDHACVEQNYALCKDRSDTMILPLVMDLTNPSPGLGWANEERDALLRRSLPDAAMALALIHHLVIGNNLPMGMIAEWLHRISRWLIIEFVPKEDSQARRLLSSRADIFPEYGREQFEREFSRLFTFHRMAPISGSLRTLYLMARRNGM